MTTLKATPFSERLENQFKFHQLLEAYGITQQMSIGIESSETYAKLNSSFGISTVLADDVDLSGVFEEEEKISGMYVISSEKDNGFNTDSYPVKIAIFE